MEVVILIGVVALAYNVFLTAFNWSRGFRPWHWDRECQNDAVTLWLGIVAVAVVILGVMFGLAGLVALWGFWLLLLTLSGAWWGVGELLARRNERKATSQSLTARLAELERRGPLPTWAASIEARQAAPKRPRGLLARFDDWLGLS